MAELPGYELATEVGHRIDPTVTLVNPVESFDHAYRRLAVTAQRAAYRILGVPADAEDVAAETLARASLRWSRLVPPADPWVATVATRLAIDRQRKAWRNLPLDAETTNEAHRTHATDGLASTTAAHLDLFRALAELPKRQRQVVSLRYLSGYTEGEIASLLGCSASSVQTHTRRGLAALRTQLDSEALPDEVRRDLDSTTRNHGADR